jgi:hypothetical protein
MESSDKIPPQLPQSRDGGDVVEQLKEGFKKVCDKVRNKVRTMSPSAILPIALMATACAAGPAIPQDAMNMYMAGGAAAIMSSADRNSEYYEYLSGDESIDESSSNASDDEVEEDSHPTLKERRRMDYDEEQVIGMTKWERGVIENQIGMMKHTKSYVSYGNQTSVAIEINERFNDRRVVIQMVIGYTQSGKTGCMVELIDQMTKNTVNPISTQNIFIITGLSSCDWIEQTKCRIPECLRERVYHNGQLEAFKKAVSGKQNVLIIIDEAHMASKKKQTMSGIFKDLNWKLDHLMENDIKLVQFSATPDGLIFALNGPKWPEDHYKITTMNPGSGYFGARQMFERGQLKQIKNIYGRKKDGTWISDEVRDECITHIVEILRDQLSFQGPRYLLVRIRGGALEQGYHNNFVQAIATLSVEQQEQFDATPLRYDMRGNVENISELLYKTPSKHTIVCIKEKMKCAQTLECIRVDKKTNKTTVHSVKHNIGVVVERLTPNDSFTIQGLLGRVCGYESHNCICYTNMKSYQKYEELFASNFHANTLKRVSWNSNTTYGKTSGKGTKAHPNINDECVEDDSVEETVSTRRVYKSDWIKTTKGSWKDDWAAYCKKNPGPEVEGGVHNPFVQAEKNIIATPSGPVWKGQHRGWRVLKFDAATDKLFECDERLVELKEMDAGSTGTDKSRRCVCYNTQNELGVYISRCIGKVTRRASDEE